MLMRQESLFGQWVGLLCAACVSSTISYQPRWHGVLFMKTSWNECVNDLMTNTMPRRGRGRSGKRHRVSDRIINGSELLANIRSSISNEWFPKHKSFIRNWSRFIKISINSYYPAPEFTDRRSIHIAQWNGTSPWQRSSLAETVFNPTLTLLFSPSFSLFSCSLFLSLTLFSSLSHSPYHSHSLSNWKWHKSRPPNMKYYLYEIIINFVICRGFVHCVAFCDAFSSRIYNFPCWFH